MDVLIESTQKFEDDIDRLSAIDKATVIQSINDCVAQVTAQNIDTSTDMYQLLLRSLPDEYISSLYVLRVTQEIRIVLAIDEDPIFDRIIWTLFRVTDPSREHMAYEEIAEALYKELAPRSPRAFVTA